MRRTSGQAHPLDGRATAAAGLTGTAIDTQVLLILSLPTGTSDIISDARAALGNGFPQHRGHQAPEPLGLGRAEAVRGPCRVQAGLEQGFVGVDVADAGDQPLIEEHSLEAACGGRQPLLPGTTVQVKGFWPQAHLLEKLLQGVRAEQQGGAAETAYVAKAQLLAAVQPKDQVGVSCHRGAGRVDDQLPGHPQVQHQVQLALKP